MLLVFSIKLSMKCVVHHFADDTNFLFGNQCPSEALMSWIMS